jgi:hypothetical protein
VTRAEPVDRGRDDKITEEITTPDVVQTRLGTLHFTAGAPAPATATLIYDQLDFMRGAEAFISAFPAASAEAILSGSST